MAHRSTLGVQPSGDSAHQERHRSTLGVQPSGDSAHQERLPDAATIWRAEGCDLIPKAEAKPGDIRRKRLGQAPRCSLAVPGGTARGAFIEAENRAPQRSLAAARGQLPEERFQNVADAQGSGCKSAVGAHGPAGAALAAARWHRTCSRAGGERWAKLKLRSRRSGRRLLTRPMSKTLRSVGCAGAQRASGRGWLCASLQGAALPDCEAARAVHEVALLASCAEFTERTRSAPGG